MSSLNKVFLMGNLTRDPELRQLPSGVCVCKMGLAVNRRYTTRDGQDREEVCFVDIEVWGRQAESSAKYLKKGSPALIEGRLKLDSWDDPETGRTRSRLLVQAERVQFMSTPSSFDGSNTGGGSSSYSSGGQSQGYNNNAPAGNQMNQGQQQQPTSKPEENPFEEINEEDDDIPF